MHIKENDQIPNADVFVMENGEPVKKNTQTLLKDKKVVIFGLPGWVNRSNTIITNNITDIKSALNLLYVNIIII